MTKPNKPTELYEKLQNLRSLACLVYDRAAASGKSPDKITEDVRPVQQEYEKIIFDAAEADLDSIAAAIELFDIQADLQAKYAANIMEKAKDFRTTAQRLRESLVENMDSKKQFERRGELYSVTLVDGIGEGRVKVRQLVIR